MLVQLSTAAGKEAQLPPDEVHVWVARLDEIACRVESLEESLSKEESQRAGRFHFDRDRVRYSTGLGVLRSILGFYSGTDPGEIEFGREKRNKPVLSGKSARDRIRFNMSRSKGLALYAFARDHSLGVDIEQVEPLHDMDQIVRRFFAPREIQDYFRIPVTDRTEAFFRCWTRKEAFLKATGDGLSRPLNSFSVSLRPDEQSYVLDPAGNQHIAPRFLLRDLYIEKGIKASVAIEGFDSLSSLREQNNRFGHTLCRVSYQGVPEMTNRSDPAAGQ